MVVFEQLRFGARQLVSPLCSFPAAPYRLTRGTRGLTRCFETVAPIWVCLHIAGLHGGEHV
jgi:hypothetical protein